MRRRVLAVFLASFAVGCASRAVYQAPAEPGDGKLASLTIYRTQTTFHTLNPEMPFFYIDGMEVAKLNVGSSVTTKLKPGPHVITVRESVMFMPAWQSGIIEKQFEAGGSYYVRYAKDYAGVVPTGTGPTVLSKTTLTIADEQSFVQRK